MTRALGGRTQDGSGRRMTLASTSDNPAPPGAVEEDVHTADGVRLRAVRWTPADAARGTVAILGGRGEFIEKYFEMAKDLLERGFAVATFDWRGQGGSDRPLRDARKGHVDDFSQFERDLEAFVATILEPHCPRPWFGLGHSMGAAILLLIDAGRPLPVRSAGPHLADDRGEGGRPSRPGPVRDRRARRSRLRRRLRARQRRGDLLDASVRGQRVHHRPRALRPDRRSRWRRRRTSSWAARPSAGRARRSGRCGDSTIRTFPRRAKTPILIVASGADQVTDTRRRGAIRGGPRGADASSSSTAPSTRS